MGLHRTGNMESDIGYIIQAHNDLYHLSGHVFQRVAGFLSTSYQQMLIVTIS